LKAVTQQALGTRKLLSLLTLTPLNVIADITMITSQNMQAINCRCSPTRVTQQFHIIQQSHWRTQRGRLGGFKPPIGFSELWWIVCLQKYT